MRRSIITGAAGLVLLIAMVGAGTSASAATVRYTRCHNTRFAPQYLTITHIVQHRSSCARARALSLAYMRAVTSSSGPRGSRTGHCFGAHSYGHCTVVDRHRAWSCFHFMGAKNRHQRGLVRCRRGPARISFNVRS